MATFDELRLQELLSPFNNQNNQVINSGITGASSAIPNINGVPMINTGAYNQKLQNTDLVSQIIAANQAANQETNNTDDTAPFFFPQINNEIPQINNQIPLGFDTSYGVANEPDEEQEFLPDQKSSLKDSLSSMGRNFGISSLIGMITGNPIIGLLSKGARGIGNLNDKMQNSMFGKSKTLAEYFNNRKIAAATGSKDFMNRPRSERNFTGPSGNDNTGGGPGSKGASDSFSNKSGM